MDSGELYVADDIGNQDLYRLDRFGASSGGFLGQFAQEPALSYLHDGVAVGHATGEPQVYTAGDEAGTTEGAVAVFGASGAFQNAWRGTDTPSAAFGCFECGGDESVVAVDGSGALGDWAAGDVYVADPNHQAVDVFTPAAGGGEAYLTRLEDPGSGVSFSGPTEVAVDGSSGRVLVTDTEQGVVDVFEPVSGMPEVYKFLFTLTGTPAGAFGNQANLHGLAVDGANGEIFVAEQHVERGVDVGVVDEFSAAGVFLGRLTGTPAGSFGSLQGLAVDPETHRLFVGDYREGEGGAVDVFGGDLTVPDALTEAASNVQPTAATLNGTVNPDGVALSDCHFVYGASEVYGHSAPCTPSAAEIGAGSGPVAVSANISGLAAGSVHHYRLVVANANGTNQGLDQLVGPPRVDSTSASAETNTTANLQAQVNPDGVDTTYRFEYGTTSGYGTSAPVPAGDLGAGIVDAAASAALSGLQPGTLYHYRVVAVNAAGTVAGPDETFSTVPAARVDSVTISNVASGGATLRAQINPLGADTTYQFQYGPSASYGNSTPSTPADIGSGSSDQTVTQQISGLTPNTTYHVRVVTSNAVGTVYSDDHTFRYDTAGAGLPDNRAYEMITPAQKNGAQVGEAFGNRPEFSEDGSRMLMPALQLFGSVGTSNALSGTVGETLTFSRGSGGWTMSQLAPAATQFVSQTPVLLNVAADTGLFATAGTAGNLVLYVRRPDGSFVSVGPLTPPSAGTARGIEFSGTVATADFSHVVYEQNPDARWSFDHTTGLISLMEYADVGNSQPVLVGVSGGAGSTDLISVCSTVVGGNVSDPYGALSADGGTVFFTAAECKSGSGVNAHTPVPSGALYARIDGSRTVPISVRSPLDCTGEACLGSPVSTAGFEAASTDGSKVFFTSTQQLTDNASEDSTGGDGSDGAGGEPDSGCPGTVGLNGCNLYEYDFGNPAGHNLLAVSVGDSSGRGPRVQNLTAISPDGSQVYFVAKGVLSTTANDQGQAARNGGENLYLFERDAAHPAGHTVFIATLSSTNVGFEGADSAQWQIGPGVMNVTPDGRFLVFTSHAALTADAAGSLGAAQVYRYDAQTGSLVRLSIGERGFNDNGNAGLGDARIVEPFSGPREGGPQREDPTMSHDGAYVFFRSPVALTPHALDDVPVGRNTTTGAIEYAQNVYEYHEGHVYLISDGRDTAAVAQASVVQLVGSDATGANVVFRTADPLMAQDTDTAVDYYDARICTASDPCIAPGSASAACQGEACHGAPSGAPVLEGAGSAAFTGPGNLAQAPAAKPKPGHKAKPKKRKTRRGRRRGGSRRHNGHSKAGGKK
ncbi:MAG TPA: hypothetical protein VID29_05380 [Solirubrobacteraceae bacterium]